MEAIGQKHSEEAIGHFDREAATFADQYSERPVFADRLRLFVQTLRSRISPPARVLDFGCGPGVIAVTLAELGYEVVGVDGSAQMITAARARQAGVRVNNIRFELASATEWEPTPNEFDAVVCSSVIEYVEQDIALVERLISALKPGGTLLISVPQTPSLGGLAEEVVRWRRRMFNRKPKAKLHLRRYGRQYFTKTLSRLGLTDIRCITFELPCFGAFGVQLSRLKWLGVMALFVARKDEEIGRGVQMPGIAPFDGMSPHPGRE